MRDASVRLLLDHADFRRFWVAQSSSAVGTQVTALALPIVATVVLGRGPAEVSIVAMAAWLPYLVFSLIAGNWLAGRDQRRCMIVAEGVQVAALVSIPVLWAGGMLAVPLLAGAAFIAGCGALVAGLVGFGLTPTLVSDSELGAANRALQGSRTVAQIAGPGLAGALIGALGTAAAVLADAVSHLIAVVSIARLRSGGKGVAEGARTGVFAGLHILVADSRLRALTVHAAIYNLAGQIFTLSLVQYAIRDAGVTPLAYGIAIGAQGVGAVIGTTVALGLAKKWGLGCAFAASLLLSCGLPLVIGMVPISGVGYAIVVGAALLLAGIGLGSANIYSLTLRQTILPRELLTRSAGAYTQIMYGSIPIGAALAGLIGEGLGTRMGVLVGTIGFAVSALPVLLGRIRSFDLPERAGAAAEDAS